MTLLSEGTVVMGWLKRRIIEDMEPTMAEWDRRWIPVEEALPDPYQWVLGWDNDPPVPCVCYRGPDEIWKSGEGRIVKPTHWMSLPEPPT